MSTGNASLVAENSTHSSHPGSVTSRSLRLSTVQAPWMKSKSRAPELVIPAPSHGPPTTPSLRRPHPAQRAGSHLSGAGCRRRIRRMDVLVSLAPDAGVDAEESERLGRQLRQELR